MSAVARAKMTATLQLQKSSKPLRVMVLGQGGVGKSALVVRFLTRRYIGEYDPTLEQLYTFHTVIDGEMAHLEILDTAGQPHERECPRLEANIRWAEAFVLMYSVTDKCSFDECNRLKFLINYNKRRRRLSSSKIEAPVVLVGNKADQVDDRMVTSEEGRRRCSDIGCAAFHEISVRENIEEVWDVFRDVVRCWRAVSRSSSTCRLKRSSSDLPNSLVSTSLQERVTAEQMASQPPKVITSGSSSVVTAAPKSTPQAQLGRRWTEEQGSEEHDEEEEDSQQPFRGRASTDGTLLQLARPLSRRWRYSSGNSSPSSSSPSTTSSLPAPLQQQLAERRMSISMRGSNSAAY